MRTRIRHATPKSRIVFLLAVAAATLAFARTAPAAPTHGGGETPARALHTGVHAPPHAVHHHRLRRSHGLAAVHASISRSLPISHDPVPARPVHHPARGHAAALPHAGNKIHRAPWRGGQPYPIGQASPSLALRAEARTPIQQQNESVTDPANGLLKGRSPPRGDPLIPTLLPALPRALRPAPAPRRTAPSPAILRAPSFPATISLASGSPRTRCSDFTTDRAPEGGPAGFHSPSRRSIT